MPNVLLNAAEKSCSGVARDAFRTVLQLPAANDISDSLGNPNSPPGRH